MFDFDARVLIDWLVSTLREPANQSARHKVKHVCFCLKVVCLSYNEYIYTFDHLFSTHIVSCLGSKVEVSVTMSPAPSRGYYLTGDSVTVTCLADGFPLAHYLKLSKDQQVFVEYQNSSTSGIVNDHDVTFMKTITTLKLADNGNYKCEAINQVEGTDYKRESETSLKICK